MLNCKKKKKIITLFSGMCRREFFTGMYCCIKLTQSRPLGFFFPRNYDIPTSNLFTYPYFMAVYERREVPQWISCQVFYETLKRTIRKEKGRQQKFYSNL